MWISYLCAVNQIANTKMGTEELINGLKRLRADAQDVNMDAFAAKQKIRQAFDFADSLALKVDDLQIRSIMDNYIAIQKEFIEKRVNNYSDLLFFCATILMDWDNFVKRQEWELAEQERRKTLTELRRQGKI